MDQAQEKQAQARLTYRVVELSLRAVGRGEKPRSDHLASEIDVASEAGVRQKAVIAVAGPVAAAVHGTGAVQKFVYAQLQTRPRKPGRLSHHTLTPLQPIRLWPIIRLVTEYDTQVQHARRCALPMSA